VGPPTAWQLFGPRQNCLPTKQARNHAAYIAHSYLVQALERNLHISTSGLVQLIFKPLNSLGLEINRTSPQESSRDNLEKNIHFAISNSYP
jgi:hypothetical protein